MQVDDVTIAKYQQAAEWGNAELMSAVEMDGSGSYIMQKNPTTGCCVKFADGKCQIQSQYGEEFLGDACALYPRITRKLDGFTIVTATMSCPEIARIALYGNQPFDFVEVAAISRVPQEIKNVLPAEVSPQEALTIHADFLAATEDEKAHAEQIFARIASAARSLQFIKPSDWVNATPVYLRLADGRLPISGNNAPEKNINDPFNLLHALCGLVVASKKPAPPRLQQTISDMETALHVVLDWQNALIKTGDDSLAASNALQALWESELRETYNPPLKKWLKAQLSAAFFPFAGLGDNITERITIIGFRLAILRLAILSTYSIQKNKHGKMLPDDEFVRIAQSLSRFLDHLASPLFLLQICTETGWDKEARMRGILI